MSVLMHDLIKTCLSFTQRECPYQREIEEIYLIHQLLEHKEVLEHKQFCLSCSRAKRDRRKELRMAVSFLVSCQNLNRKKLGAKAYNLSAGGVAIKTNYPINIKEQYRMIFVVPERRCTIEVVGEVTWRQFHGTIAVPREALFTAGIKFHNLEEPSNTLICDYIQFLRR